jgi:cytochrome c peroxidase
MNKSIIVLGILLITQLCAHATEAPTIELGKTLFESTDLGTKGRACVTCHAEGKGLDKVGDFNDTELKDIINACLRDAIAGKMISPESQEMEALLAYVRSFQKNQ